MVWRPDSPQENEAAKIIFDIVPYTRGRGVDLGCGKYKAYPHMIGVDDGNHWGTMGANIVSDCSRLPFFSDNCMDFVFSSHLLEHIPNPRLALKDWWRIIKVGGYLVLYLPHKKFYPNKGHPMANKDHMHDFLPEDIIGLMETIGGWDLIINQDRNEGNEYSFLQVFKKLSDKVRTRYVSYTDMVKPEKTCLVIRYGGFGDMIMASSILPGLKRQGYHITINTTPEGHNILREDPHVDAFLLQDRNQLPKQALPAYWSFLKKKYDRLINLSESVEGTFLTLPDRPPATWPHELRHNMLNRNYLDFAHMLAGVSDKPEPKFYPTAKETKWAMKEKEHIGKGGKVISWVLSGSSVHKAWPFMDSVIARILIEFPDAKIVLNGEELGQMLEAGWQEEPRVIKKAGKWSIRESLAFAEVADLVIGPETGVLNAVCTLNVPKIIFLSHSSIENLTRDWVNCESLTPENCECYPCHMMHYNSEHCHMDKETGTAECQSKISPAVVWQAVERFLKPKIIISRMVA